MQAVAPQRDLSRNPLFQAMLTLNNQPSASGLALANLEAEPFPVARSSAQFDLELSLDEWEGEVKGSLAYATDLFDAHSAGQLATGLLAVLEAMAADGAVRFQQLPVAPAAAGTAHNGQDMQGARELQDQRNRDWAAAQNVDDSGIARIWQDLLGQAQVGRDDDFFGLGGHSLLASEMVARLPHRIGAGPA